MFFAFLIIEEIMKANSMYLIVEFQGALLPRKRPDRVSDTFFCFGAVPCSPK